ncbi:MAG: DUF2764 family protein [Candidatus Omnitrophota bacterium]
MPDYYPYLISSLPHLYFGMKPPFNFEEFLKRCESIIPDKDLDITRRILLINDRREVIEKNVVLNKWKMFDADLKNELVKIRARRKHIDPLKYLRSDRYVSPELIHILISISRNPSIIESEKLLDQIRWNFLDELVLGHYFDLGVLAAYALKLLLLEKWEKINTADKTVLLEQALGGIKV